MIARLQPGGLLVEGTCDEVGRVCELGRRSTRPARRRSRSRSGSPSSRRRRSSPSGCRRRSSTATCPASAIHDLLVELDRAWATHAPLSVYGPVQRWQATVATLREAGHPVLDTPPLGGRARWRLGELSLPWSTVAPA